MSSIRIGTWNIKNNYFNFKKTDRKITAIKELLTRTNLDVLALQEVSGVLLDQLENELGLSNYHLDRYLYQDNPIMPTPFEIHNVVIIKDRFINNTEVFKLKTLSAKSNITSITALPHRYVSKVYIQDEEDKNLAFNLYNVSFDYRTDIISTQLESLSEKLNENTDSTPMVVMGSLNFDSTSMEMMQFTCNSLKVNNLKPVCIAARTYKYNEEEDATDHIIIPRNYKVEEVHVVEDYDNVSSHYPVIAKIKVR